MTQQNPPALKTFSPKVMIDNIAHIRSMISRIRQQEGGIGAPEDEMALHRVIHDIDLLVDIVDGLKAAFDNLQAKYDNILAGASQIQELRTVYERMLTERNEYIKTLERKLGIRPELAEGSPGGS